MANYPRGSVISSHPRTPTPDTRANILLSSLIAEAEATRKDIALAQTAIADLVAIGVQESNITIIQRGSKKFIKVTGGNIVTPLGIKPGPTDVEVEVPNDAEPRLLILTVANYSTKTKRDFPSIEGLNVKMWDHKQKHTVTLRLIKEHETDTESGMVTIPPLHDKDGMDYIMYDDAVGGREITDPTGLNIGSIEKYESGLEHSIFLGHLNPVTLDTEGISRKFQNMIAPRWNQRYGTIIVQKHEELLTIGKDTPLYVEVYVVDEDLTYRVIDTTKIGTYEALTISGGALRTDDLTETPDRVFISSGEREQLDRVLGDDKIVIRTRLRNIKKPAYNRNTFDVEVLRTRDTRHPENVVDDETTLGKVLRARDRDALKPPYLAEENEPVYIVTRDGVKRVALIIGEDGQTEVRVSGVTLKASNVVTDKNVADEGDIIIHKKED